MILLIDIGNTRVKWGLADRGAGELLRTGNFAVEQDIATAMMHQELPLRSLDAVLICCVGQSQNYRQMFDWLQNNTAAQVHQFTSQAEMLGLKNAYAEPETLGADRWAAMLAAKQQHIGDLLVVSCGTATTLDMLDADGCHQGGYILPGIRMMHDVLHRRTASLPDVHNDVSRASLQPANTTREAMTAGALLAIVAAIEVVAMRHKHPLCLLTGGDAETIGRHLSVNYQHEPDLVLKGLLIAANNGFSGLQQAQQF